MFFHCRLCHDGFPVGIFNCFLLIILCFSITHNDCNLFLYISVQTLFIRSICPVTKYMHLVHLYAVKLLNGLKYNPKKKYIALSNWLQNLYIFIWQHGIEFNSTFKFKWYRFLCTLQKYSGDRMIFPRLSFREKFQKFQKFQKFLQCNVLTGIYNKTLSVIMEYL